MDTDKVIQDLNRRFAASLPEFYQRRIIFWYDEDKEFVVKMWSNQENRCEAVRYAMHSAGINSLAVGLSPYIFTWLTWYVRFCEWLIYPTYDNGFNQKIAYTGGEAWVIRFLAIVAVLFILVIVMVMIVETIKQYKKMWNEISQMFLIGSLSGIAVLGDVIRGYLPVNLILLFVFVNMGIMLLRMYLRKKLDYM